MLLDVSFFNAYLANIGTTLVDLFSLQTTLVTFKNLQIESVFMWANLLNLWPTDEQFSSAIVQVFFVSYTTSSYLESLNWLYKLSPTLYSFDYLHYHYLQQAFYQIVILATTSTNSAIIKPVTYAINTDIIFSYVFNKWSYAIFIFALTYFFTHLLKFRYQYGFNFYFNYFKLLSDLGEQEYGSYDDFQFFLFFLVQIFMWYCWVLFIGYTFSLKSESQLVLLTLSIMITILTIPVRLLWDFGLAFGMYVRGAASSSNIVVEAFFDLIGVIIIFTRFVVQNIRFLLVFVAFFELFEWVATNSDVYTLISMVTPFNTPSEFFCLEPRTFLFIVLGFFKTAFIYLYHLLHLIIVSFMQIGVYLMVSFWLFFFLYTSFFKVVVDNYFSVKRHN